MSWGNGNASLRGSEVEEVETEDLGFAPVETGTGDYLKLFPQPWPSDQLPPPTASLLAIAPNKGLLAAAGPNSLVIAQTTDLHRQYITARQKKDASKGISQDEPRIRQLTPQASIQVPRVSHVAFSADESCLVIVAEQGGGLAVYDTNSLSADAKPAFQLGTNGMSVRHLLPNPNAASEHAHFFCIVLSNGQLLLADLKERKIVSAANGNAVFYEDVCCAAWSKLGKQIIAGLNNGNGVQIDTSGVVKGQIPQPPQLAEIRQDIYSEATALPITSISWLSTHQFLIIYSPVNPPPGDDLPPTDDSTYFFATREPKQSIWTFHKLTIDPCSAFVSHRSKPAGHLIQRLTEWPPSLKDLLIIGSSASVDIGILSNPNTPDQFVINMIKDEVRRPGMIMNAAEEDTTPVGLAIDLSASVVPERPVPGLSDTIENAAAPVPALCILNTDGVLTMRWIIYNESIKQGTAYPGIVHKNGPHRTYADLRNDSSAGAAAPSTQLSTGFAVGASQQAPAQTSKLSAPASLFGSAGGSALGSASQPQQSAFGKPAFGAPSFGGTPSLGQNKSVWGSSASNNSATTTTSAFGKPSFGNTTAIGGGSAFGQAGSMGTNKASLWGTSTPTQPATPQTPANGSAFGNISVKSPFSSFGSNSTATTPFAAFGANNQGGQASGFAALGQKNQTSPSPFGGQQGQLTSFGNLGKQASTLNKETSMGSTATIGSTGSSFSFGQASTFPSSPFGNASTKESGVLVSKPTLSEEATMEEGSSEQNRQQSGGLLGLNSGGGFKLGSLFKGDGTAKDDLPKPKDPGTGLFGSNFGSALGAVQEEKPTKPSVTVKKEPDAEPKSSLANIPSFKPPTTTTAAIPSKKDKEPTGVVPEPAPLPPAWSATKPTPQGIPEDAPLPPFPSGSSKKDVENDPPLAGSPPVDLGNEKFSSAGGSENDGPEEDEEEWGSDEEGSDDEAGDEEDDDEEGDEEEEEEEEEESYTVQNPDALSAFQKRLQPPDPKPAKPQSLSTTPPSVAKLSYTPAGNPPNLRGGPVFPPPAAEPLRSPSPSRGGFRSVTSPVGKVSVGPFPAQIKQSTVPPAPPVQRPTATPKPQEPDAGQLEDEADARVKAILSAPIEPDKALPTFYTHQDYTGTIDKSGLGGQIEKVYRDINSMIDVLGLNARSLATFIEGHAQLTNPGERTRDDLEDESAWTLSDIAGLDNIVAQLGQQLDGGKLENVRDTIHELREDEKEAVKVKAKTSEIRKLVAARTDPEQIALQDAAPLSAETLAQQSELRQSVQKIQRLLADVESKMTVLRADLASFTSSHHSSSSTPDGGRGAPARPPVPTVEAVTRTIQRMTAMVQERSGDIDLLESQIRQLPPGVFSSVIGAPTPSSSLALREDYEDELVSRLGGQRLYAAGSPARRSVASPLARRRLAANGESLGMSAMFGVSSSSSPRAGTVSPDAGMLRGSTRAVFSPAASYLGRSTGSLSGSARKKMVDVTSEEVREYNAKAERRRGVLEALKGRLEKKGARIVKIE